MAWTAGNGVVVGCPRREGTPLTWWGQVARGVACRRDLPGESCYRASMRFAALILRSATAFFATNASSSDVADSRALRAVELHVFLYQALWRQQPSPGDFGLEALGRVHPPSQECGVAQDVGLPHGDSAWSNTAEARGADDGDLIVNLVDAWEFF